MINNELDYSIKIVDKKGDFLFITDLQDKYKSKIHKSFIEDKHVEQMHDRGENYYSVGKSYFESWFKKEIEAEQIKLFYSNIPLFIEKENQLKILSNSKLYGIVAPKPFFNMMYISSWQNRIITLGELLQIWKNEPIFSTNCPKCKGKSLVYHFGGSPLSGGLFEANNICTTCSYMGNGAGTQSFGALWQARLKYQPIKPFAVKPKSIEFLIKSCN